MVLRFGFVSAIKRLPGLLYINPFGFTTSPKKGQLQIMIYITRNLANSPRPLTVALMRRIKSHPSWKNETGSDHCPRLSVSDDMPESGGGGAAAGVKDGPDVAASDDDEGGEGDGDPDRQSRKALKTRNPKVVADQRSSSTNKRRDGAVNPMTSNPRADAQPNATTPTAGALPSPQNPDIALWRLPTVLAHVPVSRSHWWAGVAEGRYPAPVKLSKRCVAWRSADIRALIASF